MQKSKNKQIKQKGVKRAMNETTQNIYNTMPSQPQQTIYNEHPQTQYSNIRSEQSQTETVAKPYTIRNLEASDVFSMFRIIKKIGIEEFKTAFSSPAVVSAISKISEAKDEKETNSDIFSSVGIAVVMDIGCIIISNISKCEQEIYSFLSRVSGVSEEVLPHIKPALLFEMIIDVVKKEEFKDFIGVVSKLFK